MKTLVTGGTGLVGNDLAKLLAAKGHRVRALVRDVDRARPMFSSEIELVKGDILDLDSVRAATHDIDWVFHVAGVPDLWQRDPAIFDRVNRQGTVHMLRAAEEAKVKRFIHTSTMGVFNARPGEVFSEENDRTTPKRTAYERSKQAAESEVDAARARGLDAVIVNPAAVYGPSPVHVSLNTLLIKLAHGDLNTLLPGGLSVLFVRGCSEAHLAAAERGRSGERYLLGDEHRSMLELAQEVLRQLGSDREVRVAPRWLLTSLATVCEAICRPFKARPLVTENQLSYVFWDARVDATKAQRELGFRPTPLADGIAQTLQSMIEQGLIPPFRFESLRRAA